MGRYEALDAPWWTQLRLLEPAVLRGVLTALVTVGAIWGLEWSPWADKIDDTYVVLAAAAPLVQAWWTRSVVSPANTARAG